MPTSENEIAHKIIGCAIEIHKTLGPGLVDSVYRDCLFYELQKLGIMVERSRQMPVVYKELSLDYGYNIDLTADDKVIIEVICVDKITDAELSKMNKLLKLSGHNLGLIINFNSPLLKDGIRRIGGTALRGFTEDRAQEHENVSA